MVFVSFYADNLTESERQLNYFTEESVRAFRGEKFVEKAKIRAALLEKWISTLPIYREDCTILPALKADRFYYAYWEDEEVGYDFTGMIDFRADGNVILDVFRVDDELADIMANLDDDYIRVWC